MLLWMPEPFRLQRYDVVCQRDLLARGRVELLYPRIRGVNERRPRSQCLQVLRLAVEMRCVTPTYWHEDLRGRLHWTKADFNVEGTLLTVRDRLQSKRDWTSQDLR